MQWNDRHNSYGWISILLHWLTAIIIISLWIIGDSVDALETTDEKITQIRLHISIASSAWLFLWARIIWRLKSGHPRIDDQGDLDHLVANTVHFLMLAAIAVMLISGPMAIWSNGRPIMIFGWFGIPSPMSANEAINAFFSSLHIYTSKAILVLVTLHICGAFKHLMFNDDSVLLRILLPKKENPAKDQTSEKAS